MDSSNLNKIVDEISKYSDTKYNVDFDFLKSTVFVVEEFTQVTLGFMLVVIYSLLGVIIVLDISYITIPMVQSYFHTHKLDGSIEGNHSLISQDARVSVIEANTTETGKSALGIYLKKKYLTLIILCLFSIVLFTNYDIVLSLANKVTYGLVRSLTK